MLPPTFNHTAVLLGCIYQCCICSELPSGSMTDSFSPGPHLLLCEVCVVLPDSFMAYSLVPFSGFHCCSLFSAVSGLRQVSDVFFPLSFTASHFPTSFLKGPSEPSPLHGIALWIRLWVQFSLSYLMLLGCSSDNEVWKRDKNYTKCRVRLMYPLSCWKQRGRWCPSFHKCCIWEFSVSQGYMLPPRSKTPVSLGSCEHSYALCGCFPRRWSGQWVKRLVSLRLWLRVSQWVCCLTNTVVYCCVWGKHMGLNSYWELLCIPHQYPEKEDCELACWTYSV